MTRHDDQAKAVFGSDREIGFRDVVGGDARFALIWNTERSPMHRTVSLDYGILLEGEVVLELDVEVQTRSDSYWIFGCDCQVKFS